MATCVLMRSLWFLQPHTESDAHPFIVVRFQGHVLVVPVAGRRAFGGG